MTSTTHLTEKIEKSILDFFNQGTAPQIVNRVKDAGFGSSSNRAYGIRTSLAKKIIQVRNDLVDGKFESLNQLDEIQGIGIDTLHDIIYSFEMNAQKKAQYARAKKTEVEKRLLASRQKLVNTRRAVTQNRKAATTAKSKAMIARQRAMLARRRNDGRSFRVYYNEFISQMKIFRNQYSQMQKLEREIPQYQAEIQRSAREMNYWEKTAKNWEALY